jgi:hypothetical protein
VNPVVLARVELIQSLTTWLYVFVVPRISQTFTIHFITKSRFKAERLYKTAKNNENIAKIRLKFINDRRVKPSVGYISSTSIVVISQVLKEIK